MAGVGGKLAGLDAVTLDAYGTLLTLRDPTPALRRLLPAHPPAAIRRALRAEMDYYVPRSLEGRDERSLARLYAECTAVFNDTLGSSLSPEEYVGTLEYEFLPGALESVERLRREGLALAVVANWDVTLVERLAHLELPVVTSAEAGAAKPDPRIFELALDRLGVAPACALHVGDRDVDELGAQAAGMRFSPAPIEMLWR